MAMMMPCCLVVDVCYLVSSILVSRVSALVRCVASLAWVPFGAHLARTCQCQMV